MTRTGQPCASPRAPCCAGSPGESMTMSPASASTNCGSCAPPPGTRRRWPSPWQGWWMDHAYQDRMREASQLASEAMALIESVGDPTLTVGLSFPPIYAKIESAEWCDVLRWSQGVIDLADGDPSKGNFIFGSPLALALTTRAMARYCLGRPGWRRRPAARPGHGPQRRPHVLRRGRRLRLLRGDTAWRADGPTIARCARSRMPYGLPNDPVMISRWPSPG